MGFGLSVFFIDDLCLNSKYRGGYCDTEEDSLKSVAGLDQAGETKAVLLESGDVVACITHSEVLFASPKPASECSLQRCWAFGACHEHRSNLECSPTLLPKVNSSDNV